MRLARPALFLLSVAVTQSCSNRGPAETLTDAQRALIADSLKSAVSAAYNLSKGDPVRRFMALYPSQQRVVSATGGRITTTRDSLQMSINAFWDGVGQYMVDPTWSWETMEVDVLSPSAAVMTARYTVRHWTDRGNPHVIGGVWTSVWQRSREGWRIVHEHLSDMPRAQAVALEERMPKRDSSTKAPPHRH